MVSHNVVTSIDEKLPASISPAIHKLLREELNFSGIMITDDMKMGAIKEEYSIEEAVEKAAEIEEKEEAADDESNL